MREESYTTRRGRARWCLVVIAALCVAVLGLHCTEETPGGSVIGAAGGTVKSADGKVILEIPAGALEKDTAISIKKVDDAQAGVFLLPLEYEMGPDGLTFQKPVPVSITFPRNVIPGLDPKASQTFPNLMLLTISGGKPEFLNDLAMTYSEDGQSITLSSTLSHFSSIRVAVGSHDLVLEEPALFGMKDFKRVNMRVGELLPIKIAFHQRASIPLKVENIWLVKSFRAEIFDILNLFEKSFKLYGVTSRGQDYSEPYHQSLGNTKTFRGGTRGGRFRLTPHFVVGCLDEGDITFQFNGVLVTNLKKDGQILDLGEVNKFELAYAGELVIGRSGLALSPKFTIRCMEAPSRPKPSADTLPKAKQIVRTPLGDLIVSGGEGVTKHDGKTLERKRIINPGGDVLIYEDSFGEDDDFDLTVTPDEKDPKVGKVAPVVTKKDGSIEKFELDQATQDKIFAALRKICRTDQQTPCKSKQLVGVDKDGKLSVSEVSASPYKIKTSDISIPDVVRWSQVDLSVSQAEIYRGLGIGKDNGKVYYIEGQEKGLGKLKATEVGDVKAGDHAIVCDPAKLRCAIANFTTNNVHFFLQNDVNQPPVETYSDKIKGSFTKFDVLFPNANTTYVMALQPDERGIFYMEFDRDGKLASSSFSGVTCPILEAAAFLPGTTGIQGASFVALCGESFEGRTLSYIAGQKFGQKPTELPPQEPSNEPTDQDGGPNEPPAPDVTPDTTPEPPAPDKTPDQGMDCSKYSYKEAGKTYPKWFAGHDTKGSVCEAMYDKVYGRNGQTITCKTDADCKNPCRYVCCRSNLFIEIVACKGGICSFEVSNKCGFCASGMDPQTCGLPAGYDP